MLVIGAAMILVIFLLIMGIPIVYSFLSVVLLLIWKQGFDWSFLMGYGYDMLSGVVLLCVPLFVCVGTIMEKSQIGASLINFVDLFVGKIRGGLGIVGVFASAIFGSISGSATATLTCIGGMILPKMYENKYPRGHAAALLTNACPLGLLIPPSYSMIIYAWVARESILACFLATVIPGIILSIALSVVNVVLLRNNKEVIVQEKLQPEEYRVEFKRRFVDAIPAFLMPIIVLGGIYTGFFTPTEAAAAAVFYAIPVGIFLYKKLNKKTLIETFVTTGTTTGVVMVMIFCIMMLSRILVMLDLPGMITTMLYRTSDNPYVVLLFINILLLLLGMIMDDTSAMLLSVPILLPIIKSFGISPIHLAAIVGVNLGLGLITPPCAPMLYLGSRVAKVPMSEMITPTLYFIAFAWVPTLVLVTYYPNFSLWLPRLILGGY